MQTIDEPDAASPSGKEASPGPSAVKTDDGLLPSRAEAGSGPSDDGEMDASDGGLAETSADPSAANTDGLDGASPSLAETSPCLGQKRFQIRAREP